MKKPSVRNLYQSICIETGKQKVLEVLFWFPEKEFSLSDLARESGVAKANIGGILDELQVYGFTKIEKLPKIWRIKANQSSQNFIRIKIVYNLGFIYHSNLVEMINEHYKNPKAVILFGSFRKGEDISGSDIDIAVETDEARQYKIVSLKELDKIGSAIQRKIQIHLFNRKNIDANVFSNIANGIVLSGFLEANP